MSIYNPESVLHVVLRTRFVGVSAKLTPPGGTVHVQRSVHRPIARHRETDGRKFTLVHVWLDGMERRRHSRTAPAPQRVAC